MSRWKGMEAMTPTSDERREVASALRGDPNDTLIPQSRNDFEGMTYREAAYRFWDMCRRVRDAANVDIAYSTTSVLADLIDPTCHDFAAKKAPTAKATILRAVPAGMSATSRSRASALTAAPALSRGVVTDG